MSEHPGLLWIKIAAVYFVIGVGLGIQMGASGDHTLASVHAHINLLGWVSMALIGLVYHLFPAVANGKIPKIQFWLHQIGLPVMLLTLAGLMHGNKALEPVVGLSSVVVGLSVLLFVFNVLTNLKPRT